MKSSYYDAIAQQIIQTSGPPKNTTIDVVEFDSEPGAVYLVVYAHELALMPESRVQELADWLTSILDKLNKHPLVGATYSHRVSLEDPKR